MAFDVDPEGIRTINVSIKVNLVDEGTDVIDILTGRIISQRYLVIFPYQLTPIFDPLYHSTSQNTVYSYLTKVN